MAPRKAYLPPVDARPEDIAKALFKQPPPESKETDDKVEKGHPDTPTPRIRRRAGSVGRGGQSDI